MVESLCNFGAVSTCNRYDVVTYKSEAPFISDIEMIKNVFVPDDNFSFPETNRSFKYKWFKWFPWLLYSPNEDAVYCLACFCFFLYFFTSFLKRYQESKIFIPNLLDIGQQQCHSVKYMLKGRKKKESFDEPSKEL